MSELHLRWKYLMRCGAAKPSRTSSGSVFRIYSMQWPQRNQSERVRERTIVGSGSSRMVLGAQASRQLGIWAGKMPALTGWYSGAQPTFAKKRLQARLV
jgi:hypothetical protein